MDRLRGDIGEFDSNHLGKVGIEELCRDDKVINGDRVREIIKALKGMQTATATVEKDTTISRATLDQLKDYADQKYEQALTQGTREALSDLKISMERDQLIALIGVEPVEYLEGLFKDRYDEIVIRRCCAHGKFINFHTDVSLRTLQLAINGDHEYEGGRLAYLTNGEMVIPERPAGSITIHGNDIVHAVTKLHTGVRYGLFLLKKRE